MTIYMGGKQGDTWTFCTLHLTVVVLFQNLLCKIDVRFSEFHNTSISHQNARVRQEWSEIFFFKPLLQVFCHISCSCTIHQVCNFDCIWIIRCGSYVFTIVARVISTSTFSAASEMCSLVSLRVGPLCITFSCLFYSWFKFLYFGHANGIHIICWVAYG